MLAIVVWISTTAGVTEIVELDCQEPAVRGCRVTLRCRRPNWRIDFRPWV